MKGYRFYREHDSPAEKRRKEGNGNVIAILLDDRGQPLYQGRRDPVVEAVGAVYFHPNSAVASTGAGVDYLRRYCTRIPEAAARGIHPALFAYLESD